MAKTRALLTETEREQIAGEHGDDRRYQATSRVRRRLTEELTTDVDVLADYHPDLLAELREVVGSDSGDGFDTIDAETLLKRLSTELGEPITVGESVYEDGDMHTLNGQERVDAPEDGIEANETAPDLLYDPGRADSDESTPDAPENVTGVDVEALDLPGRGDDLRRRQAAVRTVLDHLRENGEARAGDLRELAWSIDGGTYADERSLWKNAVLPALGSLDAAESAGPSGRWRWVGE